MSSTRQLSIITLLIIASLISIGVLFLRKTFSFTCEQTDEKVCTFLENYKNMSSHQMEGKYIVTNQNDDLSFTVLWKKYKEDRSISVSKEGETILEAIILKEYLYLKDFSDNVWWKQNLSDTSFHESYLPFDPYLFFHELDPILFDAQTTYKLIGKASCGDTQCTRYQVTSPKQSPDLQRFIYITNSDNQVYIVVDANSSSSHEIRMARSNEWISEPSPSKTPGKDQNIFLDYLTRREKEREKELEYLKKFQIDLEKAKDLQDETIKYIDDSEIATTSAN